MKFEVLNAVIRSTHLGPEDHGILTGWLQLDLSNGLSQGFGGFDLRHSNRTEQFVTGVLNVTQASSWEEVKGKSIRVKSSDGLLIAIGHFLNDEWFELDSLKKIGVGA